MGAVQSKDLQVCTCGVVLGPEGGAGIDKVLKVGYVFYVALFGC